MIGSFFRAQKKRPLFRAVLRRTLFIEIHVGRALEARFLRSWYSGERVPHQLLVNVPFTSGKVRSPCSRQQRRVENLPTGFPETGIVRGRAGNTLPVISIHVISSDCVFPCLAGPYHFNTNKVLLSFSSAGPLPTPRDYRGGRSVCKKTGCSQPVFPKPDQKHVHRSPYEQILRIKRSARSR